MESFKKWTNFYLGKQRLLAQPFLVGCFGLSGGELGVAPSLLEAALTSMRGREGGKQWARMGINKARRERTLPYINIHYPVSPGRGGNAWTFFCTSKTPLKWKCINCLKKQHALNIIYQPALKGVGDRKRRHQLEGEWKVFWVKNVNKLSWKQKQAALIVFVQNKPFFPT